MILEELAHYREAGGGTLVDLTMPGVGRDPAWLKRISERSGLHVVMGGGWYRTAYYPPEAMIDRRSVDSLAEELVADATVGVGETGIRTGIIGEIGTDKPWLSPSEERVHRAAARAARRTGLAITTHAVMSDVGAAQLTVFEEEGVDPGRVVIGHADSYPVLDHYLSLIGRGASIEFDFLGMSFTPDRAPRGGPHRRAAARAAASRPRRPDPAEPGRLPQQPAAALRGQRLHVPAARRSCRACARRGCRTPRSTG